MWDPVPEDSGQPELFEEKRKALIVEDEPPVQDILRRILEEHGYEVQACPDAESAWDIYQSFFPHLILMDWMLPEMDGVELTRKLRESGRGKYLTILMVSGMTRPEDIAIAVDAGVNYFMAKPLEKAVLETWLSVVKKNIGLCLKQEQDDLAFARQQEELEDYNDQLEEAISRANLLAMEAEQSYIEVNQIFKTVAGGILLVDVNSKLLRCNESFLEMAGISLEEAQDGKCYGAFHSCLCKSPDCPLTRIKAGEDRVENEIEQKISTGETKHYHIISTPFRGPAGDLIGIVEHITDITKRVQAEKALAESERRYKELSIIDELTQLFNKRYFNKQLALEVERARRYGHNLSMLLMDIDNFKHHNDTYGHADGDKVLAKLGMIISASVRTNDVPCRYGGEEFTVILPDTDGKNAVVVAERIRRAFEAASFLPKPGEVVHKTVSVGIAQYDGNEDKESLVERTDHNMYEAKQGGKNRYVLS